jgi:hypothetical protein
MNILILSNGRWEKRIKKIRRWKLKLIKKKWWIQKFSSLTRVKIVKEKVKASLIENFLRKKR